VGDFHSLKLMLLTDFDGAKDDTINMSVQTDSKDPVNMETEKKRTAKADNVIRLGSFSLSHKIFFK
jgi:hypothetical protein